jgi:hypothetical protein
VKSASSRLYDALARIEYFADFVETANWESPRKIVEPFLKELREILLGEE